MWPLQPDRKEKAEQGDGDIHGGGGQRVVVLNEGMVDNNNNPRVGC